MSKEPNSITHSPRPRRQKFSRNLLRGAVGIGIALVALYEYQPLRFDFVARKLPPEQNPVTDPDSTSLFKTGTKILIVTAHPDDTEFYLGGLLTRLGKSGAKITIVVLTDGDKGYYLWQDAELNRRTRQEEQRDAAQTYPAEVKFFSYPDGRLFAHPDVVQKIVGEIEQIRPDYLFSFDAEFPPRFSHRDHRNAGEAAELAASHAGMKGWLLRFSTASPNFAFDVTAEWEQKLTVVRIHKSQFSGQKAGAVEGIITRNAERDGAMLGVKYAEGVRCTRLK